MVQIKPDEPSDPGLPLEAFLPALRSFQAPDLIHLGAEEGVWLSALAGEMEACHGCATVLTPALADLAAADPRIHLHRLDSPIAQPPCQATLLATAGLLQTLPEETVVRFLQALAPVSPQALHVVACSPPGMGRAGGRSAEAWEGVFTSGDPALRLGAIHWAEGDPARPWAVFIKGHPAFGAATLAEVLAGIERLAEGELLLAAEGLIRKRLRQQIPEENLVLGLANGNVLLAQGRLPEGQAQFFELVHRYPDEPLTYVNLAGAYLAAGQGELASRWAGAAGGRFPEDPDVQQLLQVLAGDGEASS